MSSRYIGVFDRLLFRPFWPLPSPALGVKNGDPLAVSHRYLRRL